MLYSCSHVSTVGVNGLTRVARLIGEVFNVSWPVTWLSSASRLYFCQFVTWLRPLNEGQCRWFWQSFAPYYLMSTQSNGWPHDASRYRKLAPISFHLRVTTRVILSRASFGLSWCGADKVQQTRVICMHVPLFFCAILCPSSVVIVTKTWWPNDRHNAAICCSEMNAWREISEIWTSLELPCYCTWQTDGRTDGRGSMLNAVI